jgi:hypothetical protein
MIAFCASFQNLEVLPNYYLLWKNSPPVSSKRFYISWVGLNWFKTIKSVHWSVLNKLSNDVRLECHKHSWYKLQSLNCGFSLEPY